MALDGFRGIRSSPDGERLAGDGRSPTPRPAGDKVRHLIIVARDEPDLWAYLARDCAGNEGLQVVLDRRVGERRRQIQPHETDRRLKDRRRPLSIETDVRSRQFIIVRPHQGGVPG